LPQIFPLPSSCKLFLYHYLDPSLFFPPSLSIFINY
jgi:hypothetical protein